MKQEKKTPQPVLETKTDDSKLDSHVLWGCFFGANISLK